LKGTVIGDNTVIGAGSVVSGTIPAGVIAAGNPCRVIRTL
jgi:acetyltransferase-like isoleucine patch superfamily enzyme